MGGFLSCCQKLQSDQTQLQYNRSASHHRKEIDYDHYLSPEVELQFHHLTSHQSKQDFPGFIHHFNQSNYILQISPEVKRIAALIEGRFSVVGACWMELKDFIYTEASLIQFVQDILKCIKRIGNEENNEDKFVVENIFSLSTIQGIKKENIFFIDLLKQLQDIKKGQIIEASKSRIYHKIANIKKEMKEKNKIYTNEYGLTVEKTYDYNYLSEEQMNQVIKLQHVGAEVQKLGETVKFRLLSAWQTTKQITLLLGMTFAYNVDFISNLKYDLSTKEVMLIAKISREACDHYDNGVYLLVVYFIKSCQWLQKNNTNVTEIQAKMNAAIQQISKKYPPGQGLPDKDFEYKDQLKTIEVKNQRFQTQSQRLNPENKQQQLQSIIKHHANIAKECSSAPPLNLYQYTHREDRNQTGTTSLISYS